MESLSRIANLALDEITDGKFLDLPKLAIAGLLNDFYYSWLRRFKIPYQFEALDLARSLCNGQNKVVFEATHCKSIADVRDKLSAYIMTWHKDDDRVILSLKFDGKEINAKWVKMEDYLKSSKISAADT
jgi:hypothetical protein